jgi:pimeloyl-ACP methyl ester carboxylesterase
MPRAGGFSELIEIGEPHHEYRPNLLFLHGLGNDAFFPNVNFYRSLLRDGFNLVISDLDGHGQNLSSTFTEATLPTLVDDMVSHSQFLKKSSSKPHLAGFSLGAVLLLDYASRFPEKIKTLSMIGMPLILDSVLGFAWEALTPFLRSYREGVKDYGLMGIQPALGPILRNRYPVRLAEGEKSSYMEIAGRIIRGLAPTQKLQSIRCPSVYLAGSRDYISYPVVTAKFLDDIRGMPHLKREIVRGETHFSIMLASQTPAVVADLLRKTP